MGNESRRAPAGAAMEGGRAGCAGGGWAKPENILKITEPLDSPIHLYLAYFVEPDCAKCVGNV